MSFVRTTSFAGGDIPQHSRTMVADIEARKRRIIERVAAVHKDLIDEFSPEETGLLKKHLLIQDKGDDHVYTAPANDPAWRTDQAAPAGTIKAFVEWYVMQFDHRPGYPSGEMSWHTLDAEPWDNTNKELLRAFRLAGNTAMGGPYPPPVYFGALDKGLVPGSNKNVDFAEAIGKGIHVRTEQIIGEEMNK